MKNKITEMIENNKEVFEEAFLRRFPTEEELADAEQVLGLEIPEEYIWFLKSYGHGGFFFEFLGYGLNGNPMFVKKTLHEREFGLPKELLVIEDCDEYVRCIDTISKEIVSWSKYDNDGIIKVADDFYQHFLDNIDNAIDNFDQITVRLIEGLKAKDYLMREL